MERIPLAFQNAYSDLLSRLQDATVMDQSADGTFVVKTVKGQRYWYVQASRKPGIKRTQIYVGRETPELLERIARQHEIRADAGERSELVRSLTATRSLTAPLPIVGNILQALAKAGVFRLRAVLVGTVAFQTYGAMLGIRLGSQSLTTSDVDIAQFRSISIAVEDRTPDILPVLRTVDLSFKAVPALSPQEPISRFSGRGMSVEFLTPMYGPEEGGTVDLPVMGIGAEPLRFLDYLIYGEQPAAVLHESGVLVNVPDPCRFAWHKLILTQRRDKNREKVRKDAMQAEALLDVLVHDRKTDLLRAWIDLAAPGRVKWQDLARAGLEMIHPALAERIRKTIIEEPQR